MNEQWLSLPAVCKYIQARVELFVMIMTIKKGSIHSLANIHRHLHHVRTVKQKILITIA